MSLGRSRHVAAQRGAMKKAGLVLLSLLFALCSFDGDARTVHRSFRGGYPSAVSEARPAPSPTPEAPLDNDASFDVLQVINSYQEVSFKTAPKSVILSNFLEKDGGIELSESYYSAVPIQELAKKSISPNETLQTETLALVLEKQGKYAQALAMYEKLILNNPEKSSTFAVRIDALKTLLSKENNTLENK